MPDDIRGLESCPPCGYNISTTLAACRVYKQKAGPVLALGQPITRGHFLCAAVLLRRRKLRLQ